MIFSGILQGSSPATIMVEAKNLKTRRKSFPYNSCIMIMAFLSGFFLSSPIDMVDRKKSNIFFSAFLTMRNGARIVRENPIFYGISPFFIS